MFRSIAVTIVLVATVVIGPAMPTLADDAPAVRMALVHVAGEATAQPFASAGWLLSAPMTVDPFAMIAVELPGEVEVQVRTAQGDGGWSGWIDLPHQHDEAPDPGSPEALSATPGHRTHPIFTDVADRLQIRTTGDPADMQAHLTDPFGLDRGFWHTMAGRAQAAWRGTPPAAAHALADMPPIVTREGWAADETIVQDPAYARSVDRAFVHHTVGSNGYSQAQAPGIVRGIQAFHVNGNGWGDIGYNFLVDRFGTIYEGRGGGMDQPVIGAQAGGFNTSSTGVALMGTFSGVSAGPAALDAVQRVIAWKADVHHFHPLRTSEATSLGSTRYPEGEVVTLNTVSGHRDVSFTECPGSITYGQLEAIRNAVRGYAGDLIVDHTTDVLATRTVRGRPDASSVTFTGELDPPGDWALEVYDPEGRVVHRDAGSGAAVASTLSLATGTWDAGEYDWSIASPGRRTAWELVELLPPVITNLRTSAGFTTADADGVLTDPIVVRADLWDAASWTMTVTDPADAVVHRSSGVGGTMDARWVDGVTDPGTYTVEVAAEDAIPVSQPVEVARDFLPRVGEADDPIGGAALISGATFPAGSATRAVIARHDVFADALAGGPLAGDEGPLLLTTPDGLDARVAAELDRVLAPGASIFVLGGTAAIDDAVLVQLGDRYGDVRRLAGDSRFATAAAVAAQVVADSGATTAMIARAGPDDASPWADALAGGAWGATSGVPVLLTDTTDLSAVTAESLATLGMTSTIVLGGTAAVDDRVMARLPDPVRHSGDDRTQTGVAVAESLWGPGVTEVVIANGYDEQAWGWALAAAPMSARRGAPLLLTTGDRLATSTADYLAATRSIGGGVVLGGHGLVDPEVIRAAGERIRR